MNVTPSSKQFNVHFGTYEHRQRSHDFVLHLNEIVCITHTYFQIYLEFLNFHKIIFQLIKL